MAEPSEPRPKRDIARALLLRGSVFVHLDPRRDGVTVPDWLRNQPQVVLQIGLDMPIPIPDLRVDSHGVSGTLSFSRSPFACSVPWEAVFALVGDDGKGMVWPEDLPAEIAAEVEREAGRRAPMRSEMNERSSLLIPNEKPDRTPPDPEGTQPDAPASLHVARSRPERGPTDASLDDEPSTTQLRRTNPPPASLSSKRSASDDASRTSKRRARELPPYLRVIK